MILTSKNAKKVRKAHPAQFRGFVDQLPVFQRMTDHMGKFMQELPEARKYSELPNI